MNVETSHTEIVAKPKIEVKVFDPKQDIEMAKVAATALMEVVKTAKPLMMNGKQYLYFEHWQTIAKFFNITVGTEWTKPIGAVDKPLGWEAKSNAYQNGVIIGGAEASCMKDERNWTNKPEFQLRSMAQTRANSKALRSILGYIAVLAGANTTPAEEMNGNNSPLQLKPYKKAVPTNHYVKSELVRAEIDNSINYEQIVKVEKKMQTAPINPKNLPKLQKTVKEKKEMLRVEIKPEDIPY